MIETLVLIGKLMVAISFDIALIVAGALFMKRIIMAE